MNNRKRPIRVLAVDDHEIVRVGIETVLKGVIGIDLVGLGRSVTELYDLLQRNAVDVLVLDVHMPHFDALTAIDRILAQYNDVKILLFTSDNDYRLINAAIRRGVSGYILKEENMARSLEEAIRAVVNGNLWISPGSSSHMLRGVTEPAPLSDYELDVIRLASKGERPALIARRLRRSTASVYQALARLREKLRARNNQDLIRIAQERDLIIGPDSAGQ